VLSEGLVKSIDEIEKIGLKEETCQIRLKSKVNLNRRLKLLKPFSRVILSACGSSSPYQFTGKLPKIKSDMRVSAETISKCVNNLNFEAQTFRKTGGVHAAAIHKNDGKLVAFAEDIGRHNAVDKVVGYCVLHEIDFGSCFLVLSGRLTGDIVVKAARAGLPVVASLAAAVDSGIKIARNAGLTLVGFVRGRRMNVYSFPERILV
jgi:FdhD protein